MQGQVNALRIRHASAEENLHEEEETQEYLIRSFDQILSQIAAPFDDNQAWIVRLLFALKYINRNTIYHFKNINLSTAFDLIHLVDNYSRNGFSWS